MKLILLHTTSIFLLLASISNSKEINISSDELVIDRKNNISTSEMSMHLKKFRDMGRPINC